MQSPEKSTHVVPSSVVTGLGVVVGMLGIIAPQLPADTPPWVSLTISAVLGGLGPVLGKTSPGGDQQYGYRRAHQPCA